ncbi:nucleotidyltransferase family protein [Polaribacter atrinae]|uniref:Nucleotidyltransferase n=1 Tax=Polaribacter atrinae TaxID=1333662 RepID=A0A176T4Z1_9FLAO|nr:nucleotidyltransferase family protein [Polaribacter atrinae]OAD42978.1 hypothetical protein LPB303_13970 [Polaribacter atrinae]
MTYKETLFFIAKSLTINHEEKNKVLIEAELKLGNIDWDAIVKVSTGHFVFPALYCNLKKANFLHYLPEELVNYMIHITDLNRERNQEIIDQAKEINELLLKNNITPIFLKGTGNLLEGLYEDIGERMVGDIDFIFSEEEYPKAIKLLANNEYSKVHKTTYDFPQFKHHPRLQRLNKIAAIEIHKELLIEKYAGEFNYNIVKKDSQIINKVNVISFKNQLALSIIATQINDDGFHYKNISLRNAYDVFLLSKKINSNKGFDKFQKLKPPLNCFYACCFEVFNKPDSLQYNYTKEIEKYLITFNEQLNDNNLRNKRYKKTKNILFIKKRFSIISKSIFEKTYRNWLIKRTTDKNWQQEKLIQLGLKKTKPNL